MATFQVPQFIEKKPKIVGPLNLRQFLYVAAAAMVSFIAFYMFNLFLWITITVIAGLFALGLAFIKIKGREMSKVLMSAFLYSWKPRIYVWKRETTETTLDTSSLEKIRAARRSMSLQEKLKSIALFVTTKASRSAHQIKSKQKKEKYEVVQYITGDKRVAKKVDYKA